MFGGAPLGSAPISGRPSTSFAAMSLASTLAYGTTKGRLRPRATGRASTLAYGTALRRFVKFGFATGRPSTLAYGSIKVIMWQTLPPDDAVWVTAWNRIPSDG